jgi:hypothetical protein
MCCSALLATRRWPLLLQPLLQGRLHPHLRRQKGTLLLQKPQVLRLTQQSYLWELLPRQLRLQELLQHHQLAHSHLRGPAHHPVPATLHPLKGTAEAAVQ